MVAYSGPILVQGTEGAPALLTFLGGVSAPDYPWFNYALVCSP